MKFLQVLSDNYHMININFFLKIMAITEPVVSDDKKKSFGWEFVESIGSLLNSNYNEMRYGKGAWLLGAVSTAASLILAPRDSLFFFASSVVSSLAVPVLNVLSDAACEMGRSKFDGLPGFSDNMVNTHKKSLRRMNAFLPDVTQLLISPVRTLAIHAGAQALGLAHPEAFVVFGKQFASQAVASAAIGLIVPHQRATDPFKDKVCLATDTEVICCERASPDVVSCQVWPSVNIAGIIAPPPDLSIIDISSPAQFPLIPLTDLSTIPKSGTYDSLCLAGVITAAATSNPFPLLMCLPWTDAATATKTAISRRFPDERLFVMCDPSGIEYCDLELSTRGFGLAGSSDLSIGRAVFYRASTHVHIQDIYSSVIKDDFNQFRDLITTAVDLLIEKHGSDSYQEYIRSFINSSIVDIKDAEGRINFLYNLIHFISGKIISIKDIEYNVRVAFNKYQHDPTKAVNTIHGFIGFYSKLYFDQIKSEHWLRSIFDGLKAKPKHPSDLVTSLRKKFRDFESSTDFIYDDRTHKLQLGYSDASSTDVLLSNGGDSKTNFHSGTVVLGLNRDGTYKRTVIGHEFQHVAEIGSCIKSLTETSSLISFLKPCDITTNEDLSADILKALKKEARFLKGKITATAKQQIIERFNLGDLQEPYQGFLISRLIDNLEYLNNASDKGGLTEMEVMPKLMDILPPITFLYGFPMLSILRSRMILDDGRPETQLYIYLLQKNKALYSFIRKHPGIMDRTYDGLSLRLIALEHLPKWDRLLPRRMRGFEDQRTKLLKELSIGPLIIEEL
jgi:hypothetical protein